MRFIEIYTVIYVRVYVWLYLFEYDIFRDKKINIHQLRIKKE